MNRLPFFRSCLALVASLLTAGWLAGCKSTYQVKVDAISKPGVVAAQSYRIKHKSGAITGQESLREREAANFIRTALSGKGLYESPVPEKADMVIEVEFGIDKPRTKMEQNSMPVYAQVGGGIRYETIPVTSANGRTSVRTVAVHEPPRTELVGYQNVVMPVTIYEKYLNLSARENRPIEEGRPPAELWCPCEQRR